MIARPVTTRRFFAPGQGPRVVHEAPEDGVALAHHLPVLGHLDLDAAPEREDVEDGGAAVGHRGAPRRSISQPAHDRDRLPALEVRGGDDRLRAAHELAMMSSAADGSFGAPTGRSAFQAMWAPKAKIRRAQTPPADRRPRFTREEAHPGHDPEEGRPSPAGAGDRSFATPTAMRARGQNRKTALPSTRPRLSSAITRPASMTARPMTSRGVTRKSGACSSGVDRGVHRVPPPITYGQTAASGRRESANPRQTTGGCRTLSA